MKKTGLRFLKYALAGVLLLPSLTSLVFAAGEDDNPETPTTNEGQNDDGETQDVPQYIDGIEDGSLTFDIPKWNGAEQDPDWTALKDELVVDVYKVAGFKKEEHYESYVYSKTDFDLDALPGANGKKFNITQYEDGDSVKGLHSITNEDWDAIAEHFAGIILSNDSTTTPNYEEVELTTAEEPVDLGLYLIVPHGKSFSSKADYVKNEDGKILTVANTSTYEYSFKPQLVSLPSTHEKVGEEKTPAETPPAYIEINTADRDGDYGWTGDVTLILKPERELRYGKIIITKIVPVFGTKATFVFRVIGSEDEGTATKTVYEQVASLTFDNPGEQTVTLEGLPMSAEYTVEEIYTGAGYENVDKDLKVNVEFEEEENDPGKEPPLIMVGRVSFTNKYNPDTDIKGYGVQNHYEYSVEEGLKYVEQSSAQPQATKEDN